MRCHGPLDASDSDSVEITGSEVQDLGRRTYRGYRRVKSALAVARAVGSLARSLAVTGYCFGALRRRCPGPDSPVQIELELARSLVVSELLAFAPHEPVAGPRTDFAVSRAV